MFQGQAGFGLKCSQGYPAIDLCSNSKCSSNTAIICGDQECRCHKDHTYCVSITLQKLKLKLNRKGQSVKPIVDLIYESLWRQSKQITIEMEELKKFVDSKELKLTGAEKRLYQLLVEKKEQDILPGVVADAMSSLEREHQYDIASRMEKITKELQRCQQQLKIRLDGIKKASLLVETISSPIAQSATQVDLKFSSANKSCLIKIVQDEKIKVNGRGIGGRSIFIQPDISSLNSKVIKALFTINQTVDGQLVFGVCQIPSDFHRESWSLYEQIVFGSFANSSKQVYLGSQNGHRSKGSNIDEFKSGDQVEIEYKRDTQQVFVRNLTKKTESQSYIKTNDTLPLYFAIILSVNSHQIEITKGEVTN